MTRSEYPSISEYALIGDCHSAALVSKVGSIDWCCMPRFDSASVFGRLLDWPEGGFCQIAPVEEFSTFRRYLDDTLVLATTFETRTGAACLYDCFAMVEGGAHQPRRQLLRVVEGVRGIVDIGLCLSIRFDYAEVRPWLRHHADRCYSAIGGNDALVINSEIDLAVVREHDLEGRVEVHADERVRLALTWVAPETIDPDPGPGPSAHDLDDRLDETEAWWRRWAAKADGADAGSSTRRSAITLKALTHAPTGAVVAAVTTSLPESIGGERNWDYRFSWIRDSQFTVRSLAAVGCASEADGFRRFVERSAAGNASTLQIMYGVGGERRLTELELPERPGYRNSRPVRIGNAAAKQIQLDVYGYLLDLAWQWHQQGQSPDDDYWRFLLSLVDAAVEKWTLPDRGIWEIRGEPQHFVHSKVMCWAAVDRGLRLAEVCLRQAPRRRWARARDDMRESIEADGVDHDRQRFRRAFGSEELDAALLLIPTVDFVAWDDELMVNTTDAVRSELDDAGFVRRYRNDDGLAGEEGVFIACTFWLAEALARQGRLPEARHAFATAAATANDVGLFAEEFSPSDGEPLGNVPQGLSHLSHLAAALVLDHLVDRSDLGD